MTKTLPASRIFKISCIAIIHLFFVLSGKAQLIKPSKENITGFKDAMQKSKVFVENAGQYGESIAGYEYLGEVKFGYEGLDMPVLFTKKGLIHLQRKINLITKEQEEKFEKEGLPEEEIERKRTVTDRTITMEWLDANPNIEIVAEEKTSHYHTYGLLPGKAYGFSKLIYRELYPHIDLVYSFSNKEKNGFEYSLVVRPGGDPASIKIKFGGDVKKIKILRDGSLEIKSDIDGITQTIPVSYYGQEINNQANDHVETKFQLSGKEVRFSFPTGFDKSKILVIDPFIAATNSLTGATAGKAKDVDFDYAGNMYVAGGGDGVNAYMLAKYDPNGVLQWTFSGVLTIPAWNFGPYFGGSVVEKTTGNIYLGQGFNFNTGFIVVRINTAGLYDNYITAGNPNFRENWKMIWNCNAGSPQIVVAGGGTNSNINLGVFTPPSTIVTASNITGIANIAFQDMADMVIDPVSNSMYTVYASGSVPTLNNSIYKNDQPYSAATVAWNAGTGFPVLQEAANRPYMGGAGFGLQDNSANLLAINASYLFYWDGKNLKAIDKSTGATVGTTVTIAANTALMQGGIIADACNNIFVGEANGIIKVYKFNGSSFDDAAAPDITVTGFAGKEVYDLAYNEQKKILYASGNGFAGAFDVSAYCNTTIYTLNFAPDCVNSSLTVTVSPAPPAGSTITYVLFNGANQVASNTTGLFNSLSPAITYTVNATINQACSGTQTTGSFIMPGPLLNTTQVNTSCGTNTGSITAVGSNTIGPYTYSIDGINFQASGNFTALAGGLYTVTVKDGNGCKTSTTVNILNSNGPAITFTSIDATCGNNTGTITVTATGGIIPYQYSKDGITYQSSNIFNGLGGGQYTIRVKDATGCINNVVVTILSGILPGLTATPAAATCGLNNGTIVAFGTGGVAPLTYSINSNTFQSGNVFTNLTPGSYTVSVKDASGCVKTVSVTIASNPAPTVTAVSTPALCANANGTVTATGSGGVSPLFYSIDGINYQTGNVFTGLTPGVYTVTVQDAMSCIKTTTVTVASTNGPSVTATTVTATCGSSNGSITATGSGGVAPYQYSINGINYQVAGTFTTLPPANYIVFVKDNNGCISGVSVILGNTAGPSVTATSVASSCLVNDGSITATGTGGTGALQYSIDGITFQAGNTFSGLAPGTYTITVKDANNCINRVSVNVASASGLTISVSNLSSSCSTSNGSINATASGGTPPYQFSINGTTYQASGSFTNIAAGTYTVYVKDVNGCIVTKSTTVVSALAPQLTTTVTNANCGGSNGIIIVNGSGGTGTLQYNINGGAYQAINTFTGIIAGTHTVTVRDAAGCITSQSVTVISTGSGAPPTDVTFTIRDIMACTGATGKIKNLKGIPSGGGNNYTFSLDGGAFTTSNQFTNVPAGTHTITAKNNGGCTFSKVAVIGNATPATATATAVGTACGTSNGSITISGVGVNTPYHASINGVGGPWVTFFPPGANSITFAGLAAGTYSIIMADDADFTAGTPDIPGACLTTIFVGVPSLGGPTVTTIPIAGTCFSPNGSITATGSGGTGALSYSINGGAYQASGIFSNLAPGSYTVAVQDAAGCIGTVSAVVPAPASPTITATVLPSSCGNNNGIITATGSGGTGQLLYSIDGLNFQVGNIFSNLAPGTYNVFVKDNTGCYSTITAIVANAPRPIVTAFTVAATCNNNDGIIIASGASGATPYQYSLDGITFQSSNTFTGLAAGFYNVYIKDNRDCITNTSVSLSNTGAPTFTTTVTNAKCDNANGIITVTASGGTPPLQYSIDGTNYQLSNTFNALLAGDYTVFVKSASGCLVSRNILVAGNPGPHTLTAVVGAAACGLNNGSITATGVGGVAPLQYSINGTTYQASAIFNSVGAGSYTLYVKDVNNCIRTIPIIVPNLTGPTASATTTATSCGLSDGTISVSASGGTGTLAYSSNGTTFQSSPIFTGMAAGTYTITIRDTRLCISTVVVTINPFVTPSANTVTSDATCGTANGSVTVTASGGTAPYQYSLDGITYQSSNIFTGLVSGSYTVTIKDANNCTGTKPIIINDSPPLSGIYTVGVGGDFPTLTAAVDAYNTQCIGGPITYLLKDPLYSTGETFPISINSNIYASNINTLTIKPSLGVSAQITTSNTTAVIIFNGADFVTIDGSNVAGGVSRDITISNTSTDNNSVVVMVKSNGNSNGATNLAINNCNIAGDNATTTFAGIVSGGNVAGAAAESANNNNRYFNNHIIKAQNGFIIAGVAGMETGNMIDSNEVGATAITDKLIQGGIIILNEADCIVSNNKVKGIVGAGTNAVTGVSITGEIANARVFNNDISDIKNNNASAAGAAGIYLGSSSITANTQVYNNFISDIASFGSTNSRDVNSNGYGITIDSGAGYNIYHNTVVLNSNQTVAGFPSALNITTGVNTAAAINIVNNIFGNIQTQTGDHYTIQCSAALPVIGIIDYNDYYSSTGDLGFIGSNRLTLADIQAGFGANLHSLNLTPVYLSATDFHIDRTNVSNGVSLGDRGTALGISTDFDNTTRSGFTPDLGADEWLKPNYASWVGKISIDWLVPENWETNIVPDGTTDVTITGGYTHMPTIVTYQEVRDLNMSAPDINNTPILTLAGGSIQINGFIDRTGGFIDGLHGTIVMNGVEEQSIPTDILQNNSLGNLVVGNNTPGGVTLEGPVDIYQSVTFAPQGLRLNTSDQLTFKSTDTITAWLGDMTGKVINGLATVERYIPNHSKAWQLLSVPTTGQTIKDAWQEGSPAPNSDPVPGFGTQITSNVPNATTHPSPGYDVLSPNGPSIKIYNGATGVYDAVPSTTDLIDNPKGYMLFVRGDRSVTTFSAPATATVLRTKGTLYTPARPPALINVNGGTPPSTFESVGNPYPSAIDLTKLTLNESGGGVQDIFYVWDPKLTVGPNSAYGLGAFQVLTRNGAAYDVTPGGGSYGATTSFIQSGQAFFVNAPFAAGTLKFTEACKVAGSAMVNRNNLAANNIQLRTNLYVIKDSLPVLIDGNLIKFDASYSNAFDMNDAVKMNNTGENLGIRSDNKIFAVEKRNMVEAGDTIFYTLGQARTQQYQLEFACTDMQQPGLAGFLEDLYLQTSSPINLSGTTIYNFVIDANAGSYVSDRFRIVFTQLTPTPVLFTQLKATRNADNSVDVIWKVENEYNLDRYELERSSNGRDFNSITTVSPVSNNGTAADYSWNDKYPFTKDNYYRVKAIDEHLNYQYSNIVKVGPFKETAGIFIYPNPVVDRKISIQFNNQPAGTYYIYLINQLGQVVMNDVQKIENRSFVKTMLLSKNIAAGQYNIAIVRDKGNKIIYPVFIK